MRSPQWFRRECFDLVRPIEDSTRPSTFFQIIEVDGEVTYERVEFGRNGQTKPQEAFGGKEVEENTAVLVATGSPPDSG